MTRQKNKEIVKQFFEALNTNNMDLMDLIIHEDYGSSPMNEYIHKVTKQGNNPYVEFFRLLGYDDEVVRKAGDNILDITGKSSYMAYLEWHSQYVTNFEIQDIIAEENRVWTLTFSDYITAYQGRLHHSGFDNFLFKDGKIISAFGAGRYLATLIQVGKIVIDNNDKEEITNYLQVLRNLGLLPEKIDDYK